MNIILKTIGLTLLAATVLLSCANPAYDYPPARGTQSGFTQANRPQNLELTLDKAEKIGHKIWMNEGSGKAENLTVWKSSDNYASLGIGHFIWYPAGQLENEGQFPKLLKFLQKHGTAIAIPDWLKNTPDCPWNSRQEFYDNINSPEMDELRTLLKNTFSQQVQFLFQLLEEMLPKMMAATTAERRAHVLQQFDRVAQQPPGVYALIDYVNFKGNGTNPKERYNGKGWGLLQVLEEMPGSSKNVMAEFAKAADEVLKRRVQNAPKDEKRWLPGWRYRLKTYTYEF